MRGEGCDDISIGLHLFVFFHHDTRQQQQRQVATLRCELGRVLQHITTHASKRYMGLLTGKLADKRNTVQPRVIVEDVPKLFLLEKFGWM